MSTCRRIIRNYRFAAASSMPSDQSIRGLVLAISRSSGEDGPGIRTTVFIKGCPLKCIWCHSPESQGPVAPSLSFYQGRCIRCGACVAACPRHLQMVSSNERSIRWRECQSCGRCVAVCPSGALEMVGKWLTVSQVMDVVSRDRAYYRNSGGGVTFSGGEPAAQPDFLAACFKRCRQLGIHTALDTSGYVAWSVLERLLPHVDLFLFDIKHMDNRQHRRLTGVGNKLILQNLRRIDHYGKPIWIRVPLIPGYNDSENNLREIAALVEQLGAVKKLSLLPYNDAAGAKYQFIGWKYELDDVSRQPPGREQEYLEYLSHLDVAVGLGR